MRSFRTPLLVGAVALAGSLIFPGIAGAAEDVSTETLTVENRFSLTATDNGDCTVGFALTDATPEDKNAFWRADYQVDGEDPTMTRSFRPVYRPVVVSDQAIVDAIENRTQPYDIAANTAKVDLTADRVVPTGDVDVKTLPGVERSADGTHQVTFGVYQGPGLGLELEEYELTKTITVTGCTPASGDFGSLDIFGSLAGLDIFGILEDLIPNPQG